MRITLFITAMFLGVSCHASDEADQYLNNMLTKYRLLNKYEDKGASITKFTKQNGRNFSEELTFSTKYTQNKSLHFQWVELPNELERKLNSLSKDKDSTFKPKTNTVWKDETGVYSKFSFEEKESYSNLAIALSSATGISAGLAWKVPRFLSPDISCPTNLGADESEIIHSNNNHVTIKLTHFGGDDEILHIEKKTYLLTKYETESTLSNGTKTQQVIKYNVVTAN
jgi:hypothetical protein